MEPTPAKFSTRAIKASLWLGTASLAFALFIKITSELLEHKVSIVVSRHLQRTRSQIAILAMTVGIILLVGMAWLYSVDRMLFSFAFELGASARESSHSST
ncbi:MAG TPA: hypothetical protein VMU71_11780 [Terracidiphilus sp.]|nr:hypothetical protein [Terracidiphilus sp.]